ncbi:hypothetical protein EMIHUDRAFT_241984 [Emiliania huxleyi CCMP1516]|uniref:Heterokaryon incompatibility domain-containing protein n=2 Tax=Emiliania huxleyi TaxID=2903 RepID=A0A0D3JAZ6_EMIH1|nr:hypothetical protein EMIHUDRAFT_241984 [Emiliania huxleyi CCMP1516]EOD20681.1 hypothetical protein EMIHUDRAFT_241984 [Emiliania huxleyi CCMP1516]|eukprot:XP_005773110.1 hypothetical protein EMIHUDRAFT_241984 [Emiliania huxleyi CCMP1516]
MRWSWFTNPLASGNDSLMGRFTLALAAAPLGASLIAICLSQACVWRQRRIHADERLGTQLDELQSRLREALAVDRAVRLRTTAISLSLSWACLCLSSSSLESRPTDHTTYNATHWDYKRTLVDYINHPEDRYSPKQKKRIQSFSHALGESLRKAADSMNFCSLRDSNDLVGYLPEDCFIFKPRRKRAPLHWSSSVGHGISYYGDYGLHWLYLASGGSENAHAYIQAYAPGDGVSTEFVVYHQLRPLGKYDYGRGLGGLLTHCEVRFTVAQSTCRQWATERPLIANFVGPAGVAWMPPRLLACLLGAGGPFFLLLALRPIDTAFHADSAVGVAVFGLLISQHFALIPLFQLGRHHGMPSQKLRAVFAYAWASLAYGPPLWAAYHFAAALSLPPRRAINVAWTTFATCLRWSSRITLGYLGFDFAILWVDRGAVPPDLSPYVTMAVIHARALTRVVGADLLARVLTPSVRGRLFRAVGGFGQPASSRGLAAIAALVTPALNGWSARRWCSALRRTGRGSVEANVLAAAGRFRGLPWSALEAHHLSSSLGSAELSAAAAPVELGGIDAFISHSWSDDGDAKFMALSRWAAEFEQHAGREPVLWLDKACIDQDDIDASLLGLPIYVSGCTRLLVLDGPTYSTRLWCIMEIFCFVVLGGSQNDIEVLPLGAPTPGRKTIHGAD